MTLKCLPKEALFMAARVTWVTSRRHVVTFSLKGLDGFTWLVGSHPTEATECSHSGRLNEKGTLAIVLQA